MRKLLLTIILITLIGSLLALPKTQKTARLAAENFLSSRAQSRSIADVYEISKRGEKLLYIFNLAEDGFVAVAADDMNAPIIAYSFRKGLENSQRGENLLHKMLEADLELRSEYYRENPRKSDENRLAWQELLAGRNREDRLLQWPPEGSTRTDGWVETEWNQSGVYNRFCPMDNTNQRSVVGCTATAMAMIMDFHRWVGNPVFTNSDDYTTWNHHIHVDSDAEERDFPAFPELNDYLETLVQHYADGTPLTDDDKSTLSFAAGVSVEMDYANAGSGAWGVPWPLINKFGYDSADEVDYDNYNFFDRFEENMKLMRPAEMGIYSADWSSGHAIIADGYNSDNYYHLNYGWGTSNNTCWYLLPEGMPDGYAIISSVVMDIEGGTVPVEVTAIVNVDGVPAEGAEIYLAGDRYSYSGIIEAGTIQTQFPAVLEGTYTATARLEGRTYYQQLENIQINEGNTLIEFNLGNFEAVTGNISAPIAVEDCRISLYQDGLQIYTGTSTGDSFSIANVLPGDYTVTASMNGNYFQTQDVTVVLEDQTFDIELEEYSGSIDFSYAQDGVDKWTLGPNFTVSCGMKIEGVDLENDLITGVKFVSPVDAEGNSIVAKLWEGEYVISEVEVDNYNAGDLVEVEFDYFTIVDPEKDYFAGYTVTSANGDLAVMDNSTRISGKGSFFKTSNWVELPATFGGNFCIEAKTISQEFAKVSGSVAINSGSAELNDIVIKAGEATAHVDSEGNYSIYLKPGTVDLQAFLDDYSSASIALTLEAAEEVSGHDFVMNFGTSADDPTSTPVVNNLNGNYPNPFNPSTTISFSLNNDSAVNTKLVIYNSKGQKIKTLVNEPLTKGNHTASWNGTDESGKSVASGIYMYRLQSGEFNSSRKMILMK